MRKPVRADFRVRGALVQHLSDANPWRGEGKGALLGEVFAGRWVGGDDDAKNELNCWRERRGLPFRCTVPVWTEGKGGDVGDNVVVHSGCDVQKSAALLAPTLQSAKQRGIQSNDG
ncbi:hypothetical protein H6P81_007822 [Aristolochia fimbriata]|uniref:Uncharacterized protein n=1 Tax=Aristolochia fimbriata TaxID=158543 RepID=A0AAV7F1M1_ARIFI|nr:hypothetical protein H6P81_007822 [Aristolochia fimbriata]